MDEQRKGALMQFLTAAKGIVFDANRMREFLPMMDTRSGAIQAVQTVIGVIEQKKPVPPDIRPLLGVQVYMLMVDMAKEITGAKPDPKIVQTVVGEILGTLGAQQPQQAQPPTQQPPQGLIQKAMA